MGQGKGQGQGQDNLRSYFTPVTVDHERAFRAQFLRHCPVIGDPPPHSTILCLIFTRSNHILQLCSVTDIARPVRLSPVRDAALSVYGHTMKVPQAVPGRAVALFDFKGGLSLNL